MIESVRASPAEQSANIKVILKKVDDIVEEEKSTARETYGEFYKRYKR